MRMHGSCSIVLYFIASWNITIVQVFVLKHVFLITSFCRLKKGKELEKAEAINEVKKNIHLIRAPHAGELIYTSYPKYFLCTWIKTDGQIFIVIVGYTHTRARARLLAVWNVRLCKIESAALACRDLTFSFYFLSPCVGKAKELEEKMVQKLAEDVEMAD